MREAFRVELWFALYLLIGTAWNWLPFNKKVWEQVTDGSTTQTTRLTVFLCIVCWPLLIAADIVGFIYYRYKRVRFWAHKRRCPHHD